MVGRWAWVRSWDVNHARGTKSERASCGEQSMQDDVLAKNGSRWRIDEPETKRAVHSSPPSQVCKCFLVEYNPGIYRSRRQGIPIRFAILHEPLGIPFFYLCADPTSEPDGGAPAVQPFVITSSLADERPSHGEIGLLHDARGVMQRRALCIRKVYQLKSSKYRWCFFSFTSFLCSRVQLTRQCDGDPCASRFRSRFAQAGDATSIMNIAHVGNCKVQTTGDARFSQGFEKTWDALRGDVEGAINVYREWTSGSGCWSTPTTYTVLGKDSNKRRSHRTG